MASKLTPELEKEIRGNLECCGSAPYPYAEELLSEIDWLRSQLPVTKLVEKGPTFFWVCKRCRKEYEFEIDKLSHSSFGASSCLRCNVLPGQRVPFNSQNCPGCKALDNGAGI